MFFKAPKDPQGSPGTSQGPPRASPRTSRGAPPKTKTQHSTHLLERPSWFREGCTPSWFREGEVHTQLVQRGGGHTQLVQRKAGVHTQLVQREAGDTPGWFREEGLHTHLVQREGEEGNTQLVQRGEGAERPGGMRGAIE